MRFSIIVLATIIVVLMCIYIYNLTQAQQPITNGSLVWGYEDGYLY